MGLCCTQDYSLRSWFLFRKSRGLRWGKREESLGIYLGIVILGIHKLQTHWSFKKILYAFASYVQIAVFLFPLNPTGPDIVQKFFKNCLMHHNHYSVVFSFAFICIFFSAIVWEWLRHQRAQTTLLNLQIVTNISATSWAIIIYADPWM